MTKENPPAGGPGAPTTDATALPAGLDPHGLAGILNAVPQMVWSTLPDGYHDFYNDRWYEFTGTPAGSTDGAGWNGMFHEDDQDRAWSTWRHSLATGEPYEIEYRLRHHSGVYRWVLGRALPMRDDRGRITRWMGTCTDIDDLKRAEQARELVSAELSHRIKNIFAVISSLVTLSAKDHDEAAVFADAIMTRISALARAHDYIRPHSPASAALGGNSLFGLIRALIDPYQVQGQGRITLDGDDTQIGVGAATALALVLHELATNAVKYGALSVTSGGVDLLSQCEGDMLSLTWREHGGPALGGAPARRGFGTDMAQRAAKMQLQATITNDWLPQGLSMRLEMPRKTLLR